MINVSRLVKEFGSFRAVNGISFDVPKGQILGFLGPNGAGKSTTMKMLTGFIEPSSGTATIGGKDIVKDSIAVRRQIGYLPESAPSYGEMTVAEFLYFIAEIRGKRGVAVRTAAEAMRETCDLVAVWNQPIETLSKGYRQRVGFAQALIHDPPVLILDEPTDGLDPNQKHEVRNLIKNMGSNKTIILSTHILEEVEAICQRVVIIAQGNIVADATPSELRQQSKFHNAVTMKIAPDQIEKARSLLSGIGGVGNVELLGVDNDTLRIYPKQGEAIAMRISEVSRKENLSVQQLQVEQGRLDEVFRKVTKSDIHKQKSH
jgi:ABC-2 type transport system ATP-binding protein